MSGDGTGRTTTVDGAAATLGRIGGALGVAAGTVELTVGSSIRPWIGNKNDPVRLGIVTVVLAAVALSSAVLLARSRGSLRPARRLGIAAGMLLPGIVCFTTVGRLWYVPGVLLVTAGSSAMVGLRGDGRVLARDVARNATRILASALAVLYLALGIAALGTTGLAGVVGALVALGLLVFQPRIGLPGTIALLVMATVPFAALTWWSVVTPLVAVLLVVLGSCACPAARPSTRESTASTTTERSRRAIGQPVP